MGMIEGRSMCSGVRRRNRDAPSTLATSWSSGGTELESGEVHDGGEPGGLPDAGPDEDVAELHPDPSRALLALDSEREHLVHHADLGSRIIMRMPTTTTTGQEVRVHR